MKNLLEVKSLNTYYGESHILRDVDLNLKSGEMICLIGRNGVGKTTLLKTLIGLLKAKKGEINFIGENISRKAPHQRARKGMAYVPQGRDIFNSLSVGFHSCTYPYLPTVPPPACTVYVVPPISNACAAAHGSPATS